MGRRRLWMPPFADACYLTSKTMDESCYWFIFWQFHALCLLSFWKLYKSTRVFFWKFFIGLNKCPLCDRLYRISIVTMLLGLVVSCWFSGCLDQGLWYHVPVGQSRYEVDCWAPVRKPPSFAFRAVIESRCEFLGGPFGRRWSGESRHPKSLSRRLFSLGLFTSCSSSPIRPIGSGNAAWGVWQGMRWY